mmetsp:Transcript_20708/g.23942  ORF Transcript_20708/g.23942 Transcript_20708/m.23942 type:complete len:207 (+) Transcript_20708:32-652(+)|eukprot:CAMPEP_0176433710 /NCGR_PEP_ID=MMETSP0127-20121128/16201_1 /TAXON_ID=938130 /ORGANISM="Platyophrya macrostoma, Strain WH" /LENGTH=206 /DNA_ID=CAMNT_0017816223 /DNA_START=131 /DNA_END=751 /DNA_ORIENTATION=-
MSPRVALLLVAAVVVVGVCGATCNMRVVNTLAHDSVLLCGRTNGGIPGAWYTHLLPPGGVYTYACPQTTPNDSFETYYSIRNDTSCTWDQGCNPSTGTCKSYPWVIGEGLSWQNGLWYGFAAANFDGAGLGFQGNYGSKVVQYGIQMNCSSYGTSAWSGTCGVDSTTNEPYCNPNAPAFNKPDTGVVACGPANNEGTIEVQIFESL